MKRQVLSCLCASLLFWAAFNDVLAAQTPEVDDDVAAALDNDCLQCAPVNVQLRPAAIPLRIGKGHDSFQAAIAGTPAALRTACLHSSSGLPVDPLYQFMSLQR